MEELPTVLPAQRAANALEAKSAWITNAQHVPKILTVHRLLMIKFIV